MCLMLKQRHKSVVSGFKYCLAIALYLIQYLWSFPMPKMKTKSGAKKRFKVLGNGGVKRAHAFKRHILTKKTTKNKRQLRGTAMVNERDLASIAKMLPYA